MYSEIKGIKIDAIAVGVPDRWLSLDEQYGFEGSGIEGNVLKRLKKHVGVVGRYLSNEKQTNSDWCFAAAEKILCEKQIDRNKIGVIVYVTQTSDYVRPATALVLQHRLKIGTDCLAFDVNLGCSGFVYGLNIIGSLMMQCNAEYGLLMCGETASRERTIDETAPIKTDKIIFGDAGSATLLKRDENASDMCFLSKSDGGGYQAIIAPWEGYRNPLRNGDEAYMDGVAVFNFSTNEAPDMINALMQKKETTPEDYDYLVLHQANKLIMTQIAKKTGFSDEKHLMSIDQFGNTSSASIPTALVHKLADDNTGKVHFLLCGFGIGLSWSAVDCYMDTRDIFSLVKTAEYYEDGFQNGGKENDYVGE